ncbi:hypothetical protein [Microbispora rosea]|uniref:hypothetical protein n=1 Tax=Microbispora rosea TaxID=58117 RepID=UPI0004C413EC|nr:hypothetical protein [Microbispora rosea]
MSGKTTRQERGVIARWNDSWLQSERNDREERVRLGKDTAYDRVVLKAIKDEQDDRRKGR